MLATVLVVCWRRRHFWQANRVFERQNCLFVEINDCLRDVHWSVCKVARAYTSIIIIACLAKVGEIGKKEPSARREEGKSCKQTNQSQVNKLDTTTQLSWRQSSDKTKLCLSCYFPHFRYPDTHMKVLVPQTMTSSVFVFVFPFCFRNISGQSIALSIYLTTA